MIVLPLRGDVDMDGEVTPADGIMLQQLLDNKYFGETRSDMALYCNDITKRLYYFRVCDVNGDGDINRSGLLCPRPARNILPFQSR